MASKPTTGTVKLWKPENELGPAGYLEFTAARFADGHVEMYSAQHGGWFPVTDNTAKTFKSLKELRNEEK